MTDFNKNKRNNSTEKGLLKTPPQSLEIEKAILGVMLVFENSRSSAFETLQSNYDVFYSEKHQIIYKAMHDLHLSLEPIDLLSVINELKRSGNLEKIGGHVYINIIFSDAIYRSNLASECITLVELSLKRKLINATHQIQELCYNDDEDALLIIDRLHSEIADIKKNLSSKVDTTGKVLYELTLKEIGIAMNTQDKPQGVPSGLTEVDRLTGGWQKGDLIVVAARPGMGKTTLALESAKHEAIVNDGHVAVFSLEMPEKQLMRKLIASESEYSVSRLKKGKINDLDFANIQKRSARLWTDNLHIYSQGFKTLSAIQSKCLELKSKFDLKLIVIDYIQLMQLLKDKSSFNKNREQEISEITRTLKTLAVELDIPIIALSQLSRKVEDRPDKRPQLSDLRESGAIEQDADVVLFVYRPEYYKIYEDEQGKSTLNIAELGFKKHRNGAIQDVVVGCDMANSKFHDLGTDSVQFTAPQETPFNYSSTEFQQ